MNEWWSAEHAAWIGAIGGSAVGIVGGVFGMLIGVCAPRGAARGLVLTGHLALVGLGAAVLLTGIAAIVLGQPRHVWYPLLLGGGILTVVLGSLIPAVRARYRQAEARRLDAEAIRRG